MAKLILRMIREIRNSMGQFLSLVLVIAVGSFMFAGLFATIISIDNGVNTYYEQQNMADMWVRFSGIDTDKINTLEKQIDMEAEGRYNNTFDATLNDRNVVLHLCSLTSINAVRLESGAMPENDYEVVVDSKFAETNELSIGSKIMVEQAKDAVPVTVCGIGNSPENAWKVNNNSTAEVKQNEFAAGYTNEATMKALIAGGEAYEEKKDEVLDEFVEPQVELDNARNELVQKESDLENENISAQIELDDAEEKLDDADSQLNDASEQLESEKADQNTQNEDAQNKIDSSRAAINSQQAALNTQKAQAEDQFNDLYAQLAASEQELDSRQAQIDAGYDQIASQKEQLEQQRVDVTNQYDEQIQAAIDAGWPEEEIELLRQQKAQALAAIDAAEKELDSQKADLDVSQAEINQKRTELEQSKKDLDTQKQLSDIQLSLAQGKIDDANIIVNQQEQNLNMGKAIAEDKIDSAQSELDKQMESYEDSVKQFDAQESDVDKKFDDARQQLDDSWDDYYEKEEEFNQQKQDAIDTLDDSMLSYSEVVVRTDDPDAVASIMEEQDNYIYHTVRADQPSAKSVQGGIDIIGVLSGIFPVVFFLVAALIAFISMSKMVENQRTQIAIMEAIGVSKRKIVFGYLFYSIFASVLGSFAFAILGNNTLPVLLTNMFVGRYLIPDIAVPVYGQLILIPFVMGVLFSGIATLIATRAVFREVPAQAMRPKPPANSKTILIEKLRGVWKRMSYASKLNARNIFLNKKKIFFSSVGVIGCVMLTIMGLSIQSSAESMLDLFKNSINYDLSVSFEDTVDSGLIQASPYALVASEDSAALRANLPDYDNGGLSIQIFPLGSTAVQYVDAKGRALAVPQKGMILPQSMAEEYGIQKGDTIKLLVDDETYRMQVTDIADQYVNGNAIISSVYADALGLPYDFDTSLIRLSNPDEAEAAQAYFKGADEVKSVSSRSELMDMTKDSLSMLNMIVRVIILAAAVLSVTVIYNITSINIFERERELATLMVLGYYKNEAGRLVFSENLVVTGLGFLLGIPLGGVLFEWVLLTFRNAGIYLPNTITIMNIGISLAMVYGLSIATNLLLKKRISRIDMVESLKGVE